MFRWIDTALLYGMGALAEALIVAGLTIPAPIRHWRRRRFSVVGVLHGAWMSATLLLWVRWTEPWPRSWRLHRACPIGDA